MFDDSPGLTRLAEFAHTVLLPEWEFGTFSARQDAHTAQKARHTKAILWCRERFGMDCQRVSDPDDDGTWRVGSTYSRSFQFTCPRAAMEFKLTWG